MIRLSPRGAGIYQLLTLTATLLPLYTGAVLLAAVYQLPGNPLADWIAESSVLAMRDRLFELVLLTGFVGAGLRLAGQSMSVRSVRFWARLWPGLAAASIALSPLDDGARLELALAGVLLILLLTSLTLSVSSSYWRIWQAGILLVAVAFLAGSISDAAVSGAIDAFRLHVAFAWPALSLYFWLMRRYSAVDGKWTRDGLGILVVLVSLAGGIISLGRLNLPPLISLSAAPLVALAYMILASHGYRALSSRDENASLAPHWIALATLLWLVGGGFIGALSIQPGISAAMRGTDLATAQRWLAEWALLALVLAAVNEGASELRGDNRRVTGFVPLWLIAFGVGSAAVSLLCRGAVQLYLRDVAALTPTAADLLPLTLIWIMSLVAVALGGLAYALGFWLRRPRIRQLEA